MAKINWRFVFFFGAQIVFAVISGVAESHIYRAYLPADLIQDPQAIGRAVITQIGIVLFGVAIVEAARMRGSARVIGVALSVTMTFIFSFVAFWFIRESSLIYADAGLLAVAQNQPMVAGGVTFDGHTIDPLLIASMPFLQFALSIVAPFIVADHVAETPEAQAARQQRELQEIEYKQKKRIIQAKGLLATFKAVTKEETPEEPAPDDQANIEETSEEPASRTVTNQSGIAADKMTAKMLQTYVYDRHRVNMPDDVAKGIIGSDEQAMTAQGRPYVTSKRSAIGKANGWVKKRQPPRKGAANITEMPIRNYDESTHESQANG